MVERGAAPRDSRFREISPRQETVPPELKKAVRDFTSAMLVFNSLGWTIQDVWPFAE